MKLVINADDAGIDTGRNRGIMACVEAGTVSSVSVMVAQSGWEDIRRRLASSEVSAGLHFNLTAGRPLSPQARSLRDAEGRFFNKFELLRRALEGRIVPSEVKKELECQWACFREMRREPTHFDGHNHVHLLPGVREAVVEIVPEGMWVRLPRENSHPAVPPQEGESPHHLYDESARLVTFLNALCLEARELWKDRFRHADDFTGTRLTPSPSLVGFQEAVRGLRGDVCELLCHPGAEPGEDAVRFSRLPQRQKETEILTSAVWRDWLRQNHIDLGSFGR